MSLFGMGGGAHLGATALPCRGNTHTGHLPTSCAPGDPFTDCWWLFCLAGGGGLLMLQGYGQILGAEMAEP